jgi:hypothetical protein
MKSEFGCLNFRQRAIGKPKFDAKLRIENDKSEPLMEEDPDFELYNDAGFDEAFADLMNGLKEADADNVVESNGLPDDVASVSEGREYDNKVPRETIDVINERLAQVTETPFTRFRSRRGALSVCH